MRSALLALILTAAFVPSSAPAAEQVALRDGRVIALAKPYVVKGKVAILTLPDKTVLSVPVSEIDKAKTTQLRAQPPAPAAAPSVPARPLTPAEAARSKSGRKATVTMTDDSIAHPTGGGGTDESGRPLANGAGHVELGTVNVQKGKGGYTLTGSLSNTGKGDVVAVALTIEAIGDDNRTLASAFASLAKDSLAPGEKTTFTAEVQTDANALSFNYVPRWKETVSAKMSVASGSGNSAPVPPPEPEPSPSPVPKAAEEKPKTIPRGDAASPPANAPVGQPTEPGGTYIPQPSSEGQPKLP